MATEDSTTTLELADKVLREDWQAFERAFLPTNLDEIAKATGAMAFRRHAKIKSARLLIQLLLFYIILKASMQNAVEQAAAAVGLSISKVAVMKRLRRAGPLLASLLAHILKDRLPPLPALYGGMAVHFADATCLTPHGFIDSKDANSVIHRIHVALTAADGLVRQIVYSREKINRGETFLNFTIGPDQLWVGDAAYCSPKGIFYVLDHKAHVLVRYHRKTRLYRGPRTGKTFPLRHYLSHLRTAGAAGRWKVWVGRKGQTRRPMSLIALRLSGEAAVRQVQRLKRSGVKVTPQALSLCHYLILLTDLDEVALPTRHGLELFRQRWAIELEFKREKTLSGLSAVPTRSEESTYAWVVGHLLAIVMVHRMLSLAEAGQWNQAVQGGRETEVEELEGLKPRLEVPPEVVEAEATFTTKAQRPWNVWRFGWRIFVRALLPIDIYDLDSAVARIYEEMKRIPKRRDRPRAIDRALDLLWPEKITARDSNG